MTCGEIVSAKKIPTMIQGTLTEGEGSVRMTSSSR